MRCHQGVMLFIVVVIIMMSGGVGETSGTATLQRTILLVESGRYSEALAELQALAGAPLTFQEQYRARYLYGHVALRLKRYPEALQAFGEVLSHYPALGDYAVWNAARIHQELNAERLAVESLRLLLARFPQSRLVPQARLALGRQLIAVNGQFGAGVRVLEEFMGQHPKETSAPEAALWLGQGYEALGLPEKALEAYRTLYVRYPASLEAERVVFRLGTLTLLGPSFAEALTLQERLERADRLADSGDCERALTEARQLLSYALPADLAASVSRRIGFCAYRLRRYRDAIGALERFRTTPVLDAQTAEGLYILAMALQRDSRAGEAESILRQLASQHPPTPWNGKALVALGLAYEGRRETERAVAAYRELIDRFPITDRADELAWRIGWLSYSRRLLSSAAGDFEVAAERFPQSMFASNARYWQAKALEKEGHSSAALALYEQVAREYPYTYYGLRAQEVLQVRRPTAHAVKSGLMSVVDGTLAERDSTQPGADRSLSDAARFHLVRADELLALRFVEDAREEIAHLAKWLGDGIPERLRLARLYLMAEMPLPAIRTMNAALSSVTTKARLSLPLDFWTTLFPQLYWEQVQQATYPTQLDPLLILSVIRQESAFNARAVSRAEARGLMQLLPSTGREVAQRIGFPGFDADLLFDPHTNVRLGSQYLGRLIDSHRGNLILALAAYNAGPGRVKRWLQEVSTADWDEFIERLPFEETRLYVKSVLRNYGVYQRLYDGTPDGEPRALTSVARPCKGAIACDR
jgi:soluble lytic murein transglycosylase